MWVGAITVSSQSYESPEPIWGNAGFPIRVNVNPGVLLATHSGIPTDEFAGRLSFLPTIGAANWGSHLQGSPRRMNNSDGVLIWDALATRAAAVAVTPSPVGEESSRSVPKTTHSEIQAQLARFGAATGCQVWIPKADRTKVAKWLGDLATAALLAEVPLSFGGAVEATIRNIDVVWFRGPVVIAAFEVEHSTSIYSGLLRMADLRAVFPNTPFPFYIVAPDARRAAVEAEMRRPVFGRLEPPLSAHCRFISYGRLQSFLASHAVETLRYLDAAIIATTAEELRPA